MSKPRGDDLILVVDDDEDIRETVASVLTGAGYRVVQAENGLEALDAVEARMPDVVLLDLRMSGMGGAEFLRQLRTRAHSANVEVVIMSALVEIEEKCAELNVRGSLGKPFNVRQLFAAVEGAMDRR